MVLHFLRVRQILRPLVVLYSRISLKKLIWDFFRNVRLKIQKPHVFIVKK